VGTPDGVALAAGDEGVVDSLVGLGLLRRHDGNGVADIDLSGFGGLSGLDGLHGGSWDACGLVFTLSLGRESLQIFYKKKGLSLLSFYYSFNFYDVSSCLWDFLIFSGGTCS
jgi:hypothetical protein